MEELLSILEPLDWSRQATWNLGRGVSDLASGETPSLKDILPGLLGAGLTGGLAATGVGLPAALLSGALLGGINQGAYGNKASSPSEVISGMGIDPESAGGIAGSMGLAALTDPLTFGATGAGIQGMKRLFRPSNVGVTESAAAKALANPPANIPIPETSIPNTSIETWNVKPWEAEAQERIQNAGMDAANVVERLGQGQLPTSELVAALEAKRGDLVEAAKLADILNDEKILYSPSGNQFHPAHMSIDKALEAITGERQSLVNRSHWPTGGSQWPANFGGDPNDLVQLAQRGTLEPSRAGELSSYFYNRGLAVDESDLINALQKKRDPAIIQELKDLPWTRTGISSRGAGGGGRSVLYSENPRFDTAEGLVAHMDLPNLSVSELIDVLKRNPDLARSLMSKTASKSSFDDAARLLEGHEESIDELLLRGNEALANWQNVTAPYR